MCPCDFCLSGIPKVSGESSSNWCHASSNKKLLETSASLVVTGASLLVTTLIVRICSSGGESFLCPLVERSNPHESNV